MKIYFIDETGKYISILKKISDKLDIAITLKDVKTFRTTKNDVIIYCDHGNEIELWEALKKYNNLIMIIGSKEEKVLSKLAFEYNTIDVIWMGCNEEYIAERIVKNINSFL